MSEIIRLHAREVAGASWALLEGGTVELGGSMDILVLSEDERCCFFVPTLARPRSAGPRRQQGNLATWRAIVKYGLLR